MKIGVLVSGDTAVRAAHSLAAHPSVDEVVVVGAARSKNFKVAPTPEGCDYLVGSGAGAPARARRYGLPLLWDGGEAEEGVAVWGGSPQGLALALASRESDPRMVAVAHSSLPGGNDAEVRFPKLIGTLPVVDAVYGGQRLFTAKAPGSFAACLAVAAARSVTIVDDGAFLSGIALAATVDITDWAPTAVWDQALPYLQSATAMGLVMAEES